LLLHGGGQTRGSWRRTAERLAAQGYRAIALDARGHGESDWSETGYPMDVFAGDLAGVIREVGGAPAVVGASLGGLTGIWALGGPNPPPASCLVLVDIATRLNLAGVEAIGAFMTANPDGFATLEEAADAVSKYMTHRPRPKDVSGLRKNLRERNGRLYWHWDPKFLHQTPDPNTSWGPNDLDDRAARILLPTLLVRGGKSEVVDEAAITHALAIMPKAEAANVAEAGHMVAGDANTVFADEIIAFLKRVYPPANPTPVA
jgi:pimeloyl-ACP methyl ester carboxylesterase